MARDTLEVEIGVGDEAWERAKEGIRHWVPFDLAWSAIATRGNIPKPELDVVVHATILGLHFTVACRVVSIHDYEDDSSARFGFTYGSLMSHVETGEELFEVVRDSAGRVSYRIDVMARPSRWYTRVTTPLVDHYRRRFRADSAEAIRRYVSG